MEGCKLCPRACGAERTEEKGGGFCRMGKNAVVARAAPHYWEEPCISGAYGAGAVFFSGCTLRCAYCQNYDISHLNRGKALSARQLADVFRRLEDEGVETLEMVTGTHFVPAILEALSLHRPRVPVVWNTSGYETVGTLRLLEGAVDVYLPDLKHVSPRLSRVCAGAEDYFAFAAPALKEMCRQTGKALYNDNGIMTRGTLVRHLVLPGCTGDSMRVLDFIKEELPPGTPLALMSQYTPQPFCRVAGLDRRLTEKEYFRVLSYAVALGLDGYMQDRRAAKAEYTPPFDLTGVEEGQEMEEQEDEFYADAQ